MKEKIKYLSIFCGFLFIISACGGGGGGGSSNGEGENNGSSFNGTFEGEIITEGEEKITETIQLSLKVSSPLSGTFYNRSNGSTGTISGEIKDNVANFNGTIEGECGDSCNGSIRIENNDIYIEMQGGVLNVDIF